MKKMACFFFGIILLGGCATITAPSEFTELNRDNLSKVSVGMSRQQVIQMMGNKTFHSGGVSLEQGINVFYGKSLTIKNPFRTGTVTGKEGKTFEVLYYLTSYKGKLENVADNQLSPLVFDKGILIGWGWKFLKDHIQK